MGFSGLFLQEVIPTLPCTQLLPSPPRFQNASPPLLPGCCGPSERICPGRGSLVCVGVLRVTVPACHPLLDLYWPNSKKMGWLRQQAGRQETGRGVHTSLENHLAHKQPPLARSEGPCTWELLPLGGRLRQQLGLAWLLLERTGGKHPLLSLNLPRPASFPPSQAVVGLASDEARLVLLVCGNWCKSVFTGKKMFKVKI